MQYAIVTPTFSGHFSFISTYLESLNKYVEDKEDFAVFFTINKNENESFQKIIAPYKDSCNIKVLFFDDILLQNGIYLTPDNLLKKYGKFSFQTLKKFYTMLAIDCEKFLVLDSESSWVNKTNMKKLFLDFYDDPRVFFSHIKSDRLGFFRNRVQKNIGYIYGKECPFWFIENFMWYYDKNILQDLFNEYGSPIEIVNRIYNEGYKEEGVFEILLYQSYLFKNHQKYGYRLVDIDKACKTLLSPYVYENYYFEMATQLRGEFGVLEQVMMFLNKENVDEFANLFKNLGFNIIRSDIGSRNNCQELFFKEVRPNIFASSQNHDFGVLKGKAKIKMTSFVGINRQMLKERVKRLLIRILPAYKVANENRALLVENQKLLARVIELQKIANENDKKLKV